MHTQARDKSTYLVHCHKKHHQEITCYSLKSFRSCAVVLLFLRFIYYFHSENGFDSYQLNRDYNLLHWNSQLARILVVLLFFNFTLALCTWQPTRSQNDIINLLLPGNGTVDYLDSRLFSSGFFHLCAEWENPTALHYLHIQLAFP